MILPSIIKQQIDLSLKCIEEINNAYKIKEQMEKSKTIKQWLKEGLSKEDYKKAKKYKTPIHWSMPVDSFKEAMDQGFSWSVFDPYWQNIYHNNGSISKIVKQNNEMNSKGIGVTSSLDMVVESVREDLLRRSRVGIEKYGTTLERTDIDENGWKTHLYEELLDAACYLKKLMITYGK